MFVLARIARFDVAFEAKEVELDAGWEGLELEDIVVASLAEVSKGKFALIVGTMKCVRTCAWLRSWLRS